MQADMKKRVIRAIQHTYMAIAGDLEEARAGGGAHGPMLLADAVECTIDADRVRYHGGDKEAAEALYALRDWKAMEQYGREALKEYF